MRVGGVPRTHMRITRSRSPPQRFWRYGGARIGVEGRPAPSEGGHQMQRGGSVHTFLLHEKLRNLTCNSITPPDAA